jgi:hypothetical protein
MDKEVGASVFRGLAYLRSVQRKDGGFDSFSSPTKRSFQVIQVYQTTFVPALILNALSHVVESKDIREPLSTWLLTQKSDQWSFNYWATAAPERIAQPYPDDLDDTFCALAALQQHDPKLVDAHALGKAVRVLLATENKVGGPYRTWLVAKNAPALWKDIDVAVNSNIAYFLRLVAQPLPNLTKLMEHAISSEKFSSPYYPSAYPLWYYIARAYRGERTAQLIRHILKRRKNDIWGTPMQTALALSALNELGKDINPKNAMLYLLSKQRSDGSWPAEAFCLDPAQHGRQYYNGAPALSTALVIEALQRLIKKPSGDNVTLQSYMHSKDAEVLYGKVMAVAYKQCENLDDTLRSQTVATLKHMAQGDHNREIILLPHFFARALQGQKPPSTTLLIRLGLANLYGWTAYTIYDNFLDDSGDVRLLSVANLSLRYSLEQFRAAVPRAQQYRQFVQQTFDTIDGANAWEILHCRFGIHDQRIDIGPLPQYAELERLAERSLGHALTPLGVLAHHGIMPNDPAAQSLLTALKHYLIARQLHDDLRDWEPDTRAGHCSYVVTKILTDLRITPGTQELRQLIPRMQQEFLDHCLSAVGRTLLNRVAQARRALARSGLVTKNNDVTQLLDNLSSSVRGELVDHSNAKRFLRSYKGTHP